MNFSLRREYSELITSGAQLVLVFIAMQSDSSVGWLFCLPPMALISVFAWMSALRRLRAIRDTPTSRIASAAQGYVELIGRGQPFGETPLLSKLRLLPCLWYRYEVEEKYRTKNGESWRTIDSGASDDSFLIRDETGECVVDPEQAEISTRDKDQWQNGGLRYTEWKLIKDDTIYVIGDFLTRSGAAEFDSRAELNALLTEWKKDMPALHKRFDLNKDGELNMDEWLLARQAAKREVANKLREAQTQSDTHIISQPRDGKLFLISNLTPDDLSRRYLFWVWAHLVIFFGALAGIGWLLQSGDF